MTGSVMLRGFLRGDIPINSQILGGKNSIELIRCRKVTRQLYTEIMSLKAKILTCTFNHTKIKSFNDIFLIGPDSGLQSRICKLIMLTEMVFFLQYIYCSLPFLISHFVATGV